MPCPAIPIVLLLSGLMLASPVLGDGPDVLPLPVVRGSKAVASWAPAMAVTIQDTFPLELIAEIEPVLSSTLTFGDTDHDGWNEVIIWTRTSTKVPTGYRILEEQGDNVYSVEYTGAALIPYATGDLDQDGKSEIIGQRSFEVQVYESVDTTSYPTELVWSSQALSNVEGFTTTGDTDRDGRMEIIHSQNSFGGNSNLIIFENTGDNTFNQVFFSTVFGNGATGEKLIADLDGDGLVEIALSGLGGWLYVYESPADNVWQLIWSDSTGMYNAYATEGGRDTDGNGKAEFFVYGQVLGPTTVLWTTMVYEPSGDNTFAQVATFSVTDPYSGVTHNALGDLDGDGFEEYLMDSKAGLWIYRATSEGQWDLIEEIADPSPNRAHAGVYIYDVNRNGKPEVVWEGDLTTLIYEHPSTSDVEDDPWSRRASLSVFPNPCRLEARLRVPETLLGVARLSVFDAAGRLVARRALIGGPGGQLLWPTQRLSSGVYLLRLENRNGETLATGRGIVVR